MLHDKRTVASVIRETAALKPTGLAAKRLQVRVPMLVTEDGWLCAFSTDRSLGVAVKSGLDNSDVGLNTYYGMLVPGVYEAGDLERWGHPMGGDTPTPLDGTDATQCRRWYETLILPLLKAGGTPERGYFEEPDGMMLSLRCLSAVHKIKCVPREGGKSPIGPVGAHGAWSTQPGSRSPAFIIWHGDVLRAIALPIKEAQ